MIPQTSAGWSPKQERVAMLLAGGRSIRGAAKAGQADERTVHEWLAKPEYRAFVAELRGRILGRSVGRMARDTVKATAVLRKLLDDESPAVRLRAAVAILDGAVRLREHVEVDERLLALEELAEQRAGGPV